jgi:hypothetical protein
MQKFVMVSQNSQLTDEGSSGAVVVRPSAHGDPMAHQFDCVHGNEPMPQIMIQLIGCHIETRVPRTVRGRTH